MKKQMEEIEELLLINKRRQNNILAQNNLQVNSSLDALMKLDPTDFLFYKSLLLEEASLNKRKLNLILEEIRSFKALK